MSVCNPVLKSIMQIVYENRCSLADKPKIVVRHEVADGRPMCEVWFMTEGCAYDREGGCTMCNYGKGHNVAVETILTQLADAILSLPKADYNLVVNPSGSFLDEREVSNALRDGIYKLLDNVTFESLTVESRADVLQTDMLNVLRVRYPEKRVSVEIGVETLNPWLLRNSVNKGVTLTQIIEAVHIVHEAGLLSIANIGLGLPFVNERTNIAYASASVVMAIKMGFDSVILFPYHVKPGTLLETLYSNGSYQCVSLWALVDALSTLPKELLPRVNISWYRNYYTDKTKIMASPDTCPECSETILRLLDDYKSNPSEGILVVLNNINCCCRARWRESLNSQVEGVEFAHVEQDYYALAKHFHIEHDLLEGTLREMRETMYVDY